MNWQEQAACATPDVDPGWFLASGAGIPPVEALRVCVGCPVRQTCLDDALARQSSDDQGVWGGTSHHNRRHVRAGRMTRQQAMDHGTRTAQQPTKTELAVRDGLTPPEPQPQPEYGDVFNDRCVDCGGPSWVQGLRCRDCYLATANPKRSKGHGTVAGYRAHLRAREKPCRECVNANTEDRRRRDEARAS